MRDFNESSRGWEPSLLLTSTFYYCREKRKRKNLSRHFVFGAQGEEEEKDCLSCVGEVEQENWKNSKQVDGSLRLLSERNCTACPWGSIRRLVANLVDSKLDLKLRRSNTGRRMKLVERMMVWHTPRWFSFIQLRSRSPNTDIWNLISESLRRQTESWILINSSSDSRGEARWSEKWLSRLERNSNISFRPRAWLKCVCVLLKGILKD